MGRIFNLELITITEPDYFPGMPTTSGMYVLEVPVSEKMLNYDVWDDLSDQWDSAPENCEYYENDLFRAFSEVYPNRGPEDYFEPEYLNEKVDFSTGNSPTAYFAVYYEN